MLSKKIEELILKEGQILQMTVGNSMWPMLKSRRNPVIISKIDSPPRLHDVVLYKLDSGKYVLHRIVKVKDTHYIIRGDNCYINEIVPKNSVFGVLVGFYKGEKFIDCNKNKFYRIYIYLVRITYIFFLPFFYLKKYMCDFIKRCIYGKKL